MYKKVKKYLQDKEINTSNFRCNYGVYFPVVKRECVNTHNNKILKYTIFNENSGELLFGSKLIEVVSSGVYTIDSALTNE